MLQNLLSLLTSPAMYPIVIGLFVGGGRLLQWMSENKAKRELIHRQQTARTESLRTGKPLADPGTVDMTAAELQASTRASSSTKAAGQARLEALRQQRIEQLRNLRQQRSGAAQQTPQQSAQQSSQSQQPRVQPQRAAGPGRASQRATPRVSQQTPKNRRANQSGPRSQSQPQNPQLDQAMQRRRAIEAERARAQAAQKDESRRVRRGSETSPDAKNRLGKLEVNPELNKHVGTLHVDHADDPIVDSYKNSRMRGDAEGLKQILRNRQSVRNAILTAEILSKPIALRDQPGLF